MSTSRTDGPSAEDIESLIELFKQSGWDEFHLAAGKLEIFLSNDPLAAGPARAVAALAVPATAAGDSAGVTSAAAAPAPQARGEDPIPEGLVALRAPNLGTFYRAPKPGAPPYIELGWAIDEDTEVGLIEVMKLFTPVRAGCRGIVREIRARDGQMVEFEDVLMLIEPTN